MSHGHDAVWFEGNRVSTVSISIDGPTASGKTTLATSLARLLGLAFLDSGLTYRAVAYALGRQQLTPSSPDLWSIIEHRPATFRRIGSETVGEGPAVRFCGRDVTGDIWGPEQDERLKAVATDPSWRAEILRMHREIVSGHTDIVVVGRDVAMTLLPAATLNVYLTASLVVRRERRRAQYLNVRNRSSTVGPATPRDLENRNAIRALPAAKEIESTYLPADVVLTSVIREIRAGAS